MEIKAVGLTVELIPAELEPMEAFVDGIERSLGVPFDIRIVDAEDHRTAMAASIEPIENKGARATYMKVTCGRGRKADTYHTKNL